LFEAHYQEIHRHLYRIVGTGQEAEDLAQETFLRLFDSLGSRGSLTGWQADENNHNVRAWLYRVATNLAYNAIRGNRRREQREERVMASGSAPEDPSVAAERSSERHDVRRVLAALPERQSKLLLLRYAGLSYRELAHALDVAPASVGTLLARAHRAFEAAYGKSEAVSQRGEHHEV
jgi:RNA polymerase sigma-70 factor (ECF subfamily)